LNGVLDAADTRAMMGAIDRLGATVERRSEPDDVGSINVSVTGAGPSPVDPADRKHELIELDVAQSGTTGRFVLAAVAARPGRFRLDGDPQLRRRPFSDQVQALRSLGADIEGERLPLSVIGRRLEGTRVSVSGSTSSQFLSGLLLAAPCFAGPTTSIEVDDELVSRPYVDLTIATMARFGVHVEVTGDPRRFVVPATGYRATDIGIEPDASAASYFFAAAAMTGGRVRIDGLGRSTIQGDLRFVDVLASMGAGVVIGDDYTEVTGPEVLRGVTVDMADISDTAQTLAVVATRAEGPTRITGIGFIRHKETDRVAAPVNELRRLGIDAEATDDGMIIRPGRPRAGLVETYDDHRMAMSFALLGLCGPGIDIAAPDCVSKTFPRFFQAVDQLR
jgi:3-phosphoshikimate 1-carboxyvinyltransferase